MKRTIRLLSTVFLFFVLKWKIIEPGWHLIPIFLGFPVAQLVKNVPAMRETLVRPLSWEDPLEKGKATHSSILAWLVRRQGSQVSMRVARGSASWLSSHGMLL